MVEAARTGEQGRGFAVVAGEVRNLVRCIADAGREIKLLMESGVWTADTGDQRVADAGSAMHDIVSLVKRVHELVDEITVATAEQNDGIGDMNRSVVELDRGTLQTAAPAEESAAAARMLGDQASRLLQGVSNNGLAAG